MRVRRGVATIILGLVIAAIGFAVTSSQELRRPNDIVWQVVASGSALKSVYVTAHGRRGWAVGDNGLIVATEDGGGHWTRQTSSTESNLLGVAFAADGRRGWAVGQNGSIVATEDGGGRWTPQTTSIDNDLSGVAFAADGRRGWAIGDNGSIVATEDGGGHWTRQTSSTENNLSAVAFAADGRHGWAVGQNGSILATEDGGEYWTPQTSSTENDLLGVAFAADGRRGWAVGENGSILATEDGGGQWTRQTSSTDNDLLGVAFAADGRRGWVVGNKGSIVATEDGGGHWARQTSSTENTLRGVAFAADGRRGWAVGENGSIVATEDGGGHWTRQTISTNNDLLGVAFAADGRHGWAVGQMGSILLPLERTDLDKPSIKLVQSALNGKIEIIFILHSDPWLPVWASRIEARTEKRGWSPVGLAAAEPVTGGNLRWRLSWKPADQDFRPGDTIQLRVLIYTGAIDPIPEILGSLVFDPWWERLWRDHQTAIIAGGVPFGLFVVYASAFLLVLLFAPARLAGVGSAPLDGIPAPTGNLAFAWGLVRKLWETVLLLWLCRNRRVRRAWVGEYAGGRSKLGDLGKFARERFVNEPEVLDAWVNARVARVRDALDALELYGQRQIYIPLPVRVGMARVAERPDAAMLRETFTRPRAVVCIVGGGGSGKSTLACAMARWAISDDPTERLAPQRMVPVFIVNDTRSLEAAAVPAMPW